MSNKKAKHNKNTQNKALVNNDAANNNTEVVAENNAEEKNFYPNIAYNKAKRSKFWMLIIVMFASILLMVGAFIAMPQAGLPFALVFLFIFIIMFAFIPSALKAHPVKAGVPQLTVKKKEIIAQNKVLTAQDIERVDVTVLLAPISKLDSENKAFIKEFSEKYPEEEQFGMLDITLKNGPKFKKGEMIFLTVEDCLGALTALVGAGVKHYRILFSLKKLNEEAKFSITKEETKKQSLSDTSSKDRMKQLL